MYDRLRRRGALCFADSHDRQRPALHDSVSRDDFLRRHGMDAAAAIREGEVLDEFYQSLLERAGDFRNVLLAIEHCARRGKAAGPNGLRLSDLDRYARHDLARVLGELITSGEYQPGETWTKRISKGVGRGFREITIQDANDRVVERAVLQVIRLLTETQYFDTNLGFRSPGYAREDALALAERLSSDTGRWVWISEDQRDAFDNVPIGRLMQAIQPIIRNDQLCGFIQRLVQTSRRRGIRQGGPLSPELLNLYNHTYLDRWWQRRYPDVPLLRVADDILILASSVEEAHDLHGALADQCRSIGLSVKGTAETSIVDMRQGQAVQWLGFSVAQGERGLDVSIASKAWSKLVENLQLSWETDYPEAHAVDCVDGWVGQQGAAFREQDVQEVLARVQRSLSEAGFEVVLSPGKFASAWSKAHRESWVRVRRNLFVSSRRCSGSAVRSARQHFSLAASLRLRDEACSTVTYRSEPPRRQLHLYTDGSSDPDSGVGGWAYLIINEDSPLDLSDQQAGSHPRASNNRMELEAVLQGLRAIGEEPACITIKTDSEYVERGLNEYLPIWLSSRPDSRFKDPIPSHPRLWRRVIELINRHEVYCIWIPGHSGHTENEIVDRLAGSAVRDHLAACTLCPA
ncbi:RNase H family protein [Roseiconus lacunae]|uniref:RNase H family protein n=1 Tax=Roseiconus lacunae TaxID=2605694 RepID=UPI001E28B666|nr:RNase H family protein [Roseiconus lacunae]MCD0460681.1 hypothetical protein [Roseiconus lacunae]